MKSRNILIHVLFIFLFGQTSYGILTIPDDTEYILEATESICSVGKNSTLTVQEGGWINELYLNTGSNLIMNGGYIASTFSSINTAVVINAGEIESLGVQSGEINGGHVGSVGFSKIGYVKGGIIRELYAGSLLEITGGSINHLIVAGTETNVNIFSVGISNLYIQVDGTASIFARQFKLDGEDIEYGTLFANGDVQVHTLEYQLENGQVGQVEINLIYDASLVLIPEPATVFLLGLGCMALRRKILK